MATMIVVVLAGVLFSYFATLNTAFVGVSLGGAVYSIPLYLVVLGSLLIGLLISGVINLADSIGASLAIRNRESRIKESDKEVENLKVRINELELENAELRTTLDGGTENKPYQEHTHYDHEDYTEHKPGNIVDRIRHSFS
jgi:uncharacterized integral membrane protein